MEDLDSHILFLAPCIDERSPFVENFSVSQRKTVKQISPRFLSSAEYSRPSDTTSKLPQTQQFTTVSLQNPDQYGCGKYESSTVCRGLMWSLQGGEGHDKEISSSHGIVGK